MTDTRRTSGDAAALPADVLEQVREALVDAVPKSPYLHNRALAALDALRSLRPVGQDRDAARMESVAKAIYEQWRHQDGYVPWVDGGNSHKQHEARDIARAAMSAAPDDGEKT